MAERRQRAVRERCGRSRRGPDANSAFVEGQLAPPVAVDAFEDGELHHVRIVCVPGRLDVFLDDMTTPVLASGPRR